MTDRLIVRRGYIYIETSKMLAQRYKKKHVKISVTKITISLQKDYNL